VAAASLLPAGIFAVSLALMLVRPRRLPDWGAALGGGVAMVAVGVLPLGDAARALADQWNVFLFFLGLGLAAAVADRAGLFRAVADLAARTAGGSQRRLLVALVVAGVLVTAVLSNDATALLLTPVAFAVATRLGLDPRPYAFACALVANAASFLLPVSNPSNLLILARAPLPLGAFLAHLLLPSALAVAGTLAGLLVVFRHELATPFVPAAEPSAPPAGRSVASAGVGVGGLMALYVVGAALGWPLGPVAVAGALALLALHARTDGWEPAALARELPWGLFPLFGGLVLLVQGAERVGLFGPLVGAVAAAERLGTSGLPLVVLGLAALANVLNNLPTALVAASALGSLPPDVARGDLAAAVIVGTNLGPNVTTIGSLATMLWLVLLRRRGVDISPLAYLRVGVVVTVPTLVVAAAGLWLVARLMAG
jgi:arsenical pump membrane protein